MTTNNKKLNQLLNFKPDLNNYSTILHDDISYYNIDTSSINSKSTLFDIIFNHYFKYMDKSTAKILANEYINQLSNIL